MKDGRIKKSGKKKGTKYFIDDSGKKTINRQ